MMSPELVGRLRSDDEERASAMNVSSTSIAFKFSGGTINVGVLKSFKRAPTGDKYTMRMLVDDAMSTMEHIAYEHCTIEIVLDAETFYNVHSTKPTDTVKTKISDIGGDGMCTFVVAVSARNT